jgi:hypothetical protein
MSCCTLPKSPAPWLLLQGVITLPDRLIRLASYPGAWPHCGRHLRARLIRRLAALLILAVVIPTMCFASLVTPTQPTAAPPPIDWKRIASLKPDLKVLILVKSDRPLCLEDLAMLAAKGLVPADRDPGLLLGFQSAVFAARLDKWIKARPLPAPLSGTVLERFAMAGIYRVGFKVEAPGYTGPLELQITAPREGFGRKLVYSEHVVRPSCSQTMTIDPAGNRWLKVRFANVHYGESIKFYFGFEYDVNVRELLDHDLMLAGRPLDKNVPSEAQAFLKPGYKIDPNLRSAKAWAAQGGSGPPDARKEFKRLTEFIKRTVTYDKHKRSAYFGGKMVYPDLDLMYQDVGETLARRSGACPDTSLLECAFMRARGIPCRTAGRFGHFFTMVYVPGRGWMSTSVTPTGIPLIRSPGPDHVPYQRWTPKIPLKTTRWEARVRIDPPEE